MADLNRNIRITLDIVRGNTQAATAIIREVEKLKGGYEQITSSVMKYNAMDKKANAIMDNYTAGVISGKQAIEQMTAKTKGLTQAALNNQWLAKEAKEAGLTQKVLAEQMAASGVSLQQMTNKSTKTGKSLGKLGKQTKETRKAMAGFRMEFLSTMFAGMALYGAMMSLLKPAFQAVGIFDVISMILTVFFLPIALQVLDWVLLMGDKLMNMSEKWQKFWGWVVLIAAGIGLFLMVGSQLMLLFGSFSFAIGSLLTLLIPLGVILLFLAIYFLGLSTSIGSVSAASTDMGTKITEVGGKVEKSKCIISSFIDKLKELWKSFQEAKSAGTLSEVIFKSITNGISKLVGWLTSMIPTLIQTGANLLIAIITGIISQTEKIVEAISTLITTIVRFISDYLPQIIDAGIKILNAIIKGIVDNIGILLDAALKIIQALLDFILQNLSILIQVAVDIISAIVKFISDNIPDLLDAALKILTAIVDGIIKNIDILIKAVITIIMAIVQWISDNIDLIVDAAEKIRTALVDGLLNNIDLIVDAVIKIIIVLLDAITKNLPKIIDSGQKILMSIVNGISQNMDKIVEAIVNVIFAISDWVAKNPGKPLQIGLDIAWGIIKGIGKGLYGLGKSILNNIFGGGNGATASMPSFATGGVMPYTGVAMLHKGETITPSSGSSNNSSNYAYSPNITINANVSNDYDVRRLADELSKYWVNDMERMSKGRGIV